MTDSLLLALGALGCFAAGDITAKCGEAAGAKPPTFLLYQSLAFLVFVLLFAGLTGGIGELVAPTWWYGAVAGLLMYGGLLGYLRSLRCGDASVTVPIFRLNFVVTALLAFVVLGEPPTPLKLLGLVLAASSIALFVVHAVDSTGPADRWLWLGLAVAITAVGSTGVLVKLAQQAGGSSIGLLLAQQWLIAALAAGSGLLTRQAHPRDARLRHAVLSGCIQAIGTLLLFAALRQGEASVIVPVVQLSFVLTAVLAVVFLGERLNRVKLLAIGLAVLAVGTFALG